MQILPIDGLLNYLSVPELNRAVLKIGHELLYVMEKIAQRRVKQLVLLYRLNNKLVI